MNNTIVNIRYKQLQRDYNRLNNGVLSPLLKLQDGQCYVLDPLTVKGIRFTPDTIEFTAKNRGTITYVRIPISQVLGIRGHFEGVGE